MADLDTQIATLRAYSEALNAMRQGVSLDASQKLAKVTPALSAKAMAEAADTISSLRDENRALKEAVTLNGGKF